MAKEYPSLTPALRDFIARQHIFFAATAAPDARINISPRSTREFRVLGDNEVCWLDLTGSGAETAAHLPIDPRLTIMFCAFDGPPNILRLYGRGEILHRNGPGFARVLQEQFGGAMPVGARQVVRLDVDLVKTSCGYGVPAFDYRQERAALDNWAAAKGRAGVEDYWREKNVFSMDGLPTGVVETA